jgi:hypothetical protein
MSDTCSEKPQECLYINCCGISWPYPTPSTSSATNTPENTEEDPDAHEPAGGGNIQMEYSSD